MTLQELIDHLTSARKLGAENVWIESDTESFDLLDIEHHMVFGNVILKVGTE